MAILLSGVWLEAQQGFMVMFSLYSWGFHEIAQAFPDWCRIIEILWDPASDPTVAMIFIFAASNQTGSKEL